MDNISKKKAMSFLRALIDQPLCYGVKSPNIDLYDFGFGDQHEITNRSGEIRKCCTYILHITCRFKVICKCKKHPPVNYYEDTPCDTFHANIRDLIGLKVKRIALSDKNDLWLDLEEYWIVFATFENGEESWRYFTFSEESPHLIASNTWLMAE